MQIALRNIKFAPIQAHKNDITMPPNRNIFLVNLWGETTGHRYIPLTKASDAALWCLLWSAPKQTFEQAVELPVIWDAVMSMWRHCKNLPT